MKSSRAQALAVALLAMAWEARAAEPWKTTPLPTPMTTPAEQGRVAVDGVQLWWASFGAGEQVILLHGGADDGSVSLIVKMEKTVILPAPVRCSWVKLRVDSVYRGTKWNDLAVSELHPLAKAE